ncbi:MAG: DUF3352 domain-containing protein [Chloroflexota bacterium]
MKKLTWIVLALLLTLGALALPAAAQDEAHSLAQYFPEQTRLYMEFRTDEDTLQTLDALVTKVAELIPNSDMSASLMEMVDEGLAKMTPDGSFATTVRPWLGDMAALGVTEFDPDNMSNISENVTVAIAITDQAGAEDFFALAPDIDQYTVEAGDGYTLYTPNGSNPDNPTLIFRSDVILLTSSAALAETGGIIDAPLSGNAAFSTALNLLPEASYPMSAYIDTPAFLDAVIQQADNIDAAEMAIMNPLLDLLQPQAIGLTLLDDRSLVMDIASPSAPDTGTSLAMGGSTPIDPAFAQYIPANTPFVIQSANLYGTYQATLENLRSFAEMTDTSGGSTNRQQMRMITFGINFVVQGLTGLSSEEALGWMTGDYAFAVGLTPAFADSRNLMSASQSLPVDFALMLEVTDADAAQALYDGLSESLSGLDTDTVSVTATDDAIEVTLTPDNSPFPIHLMIAHNDAVFVIGTERMVTAALDPQNGLDTDANYTAASGYFLDGANTVLYLSADGLRPLTRVMINESNSSDVRSSGRDLKTALGLFDSVSISSATLPENAGLLARLVWTLPE